MVNYNFSHNGSEYDLDFPDGTTPQQAAGIIKNTVIPKLELTKIPKPEDNALTNLMASPSVAKGLMPKNIFNTQEEYIPSPSEPPSNLINNIGSTTKNKIVSNLGSQGEELIRQLETGESEAPSKVGNLASRLIAPLDRWATMFAGPVVNTIPTVEEGSGDIGLTESEKQHAQEATKEAWEKTFSPTSWFEESDKKFLIGRDAISKMSGPMAKKLFKNENWYDTVMFKANVPVNIVTSGVEKAIDTINFVGEYADRLDPTPDTLKKFIREGTKVGMEALGFNKQNLDVLKSINPLLSAGKTVEALTSTSKEGYTPSQKVVKYGLDALGIAYDSVVSLDTLLFGTKVLKLGKSASNIRAGTEVLTKKGVNRLGEITADLIAHSDKAVPGGITSLGGQVGLREIAGKKLLKEAATVGGLIDRGGVQILGKTIPTTPEIFATASKYGKKLYPFAKYSKLTPEEKIVFDDAAVKLRYLEAVYQDNVGKIIKDVKPDDLARINLAIDTGLVDELPDVLRKKAQSVKEFTDALASEEWVSGINVGYIEDYATRLYKNKKVFEKLKDPKVTGKLNAEKKRVFTRLSDAYKAFADVSVHEEIDALIENIVRGIDLKGSLKALKRIGKDGLDPNLNLAETLLARSRASAKAVSQVDLMKNLKKEGIAVPKKVSKGYKVKELDYAKATDDIVDNMQEGGSNLGSREKKLQFKNEKAIGVKRAETPPPVKGEPKPTEFIDPSITHVEHIPDQINLPKEPSGMLSLAEDNGKIIDDLELDYLRRRGQVELPDANVPKEYLALPPATADKMGGILLDSADDALVRRLNKQFDYPQLEAHIEKVANGTATTEDVANVLKNYDKSTKNALDILGAEKAKIKNYTKKVRNNKAYTSEMVDYGSVAKELKGFRIPKRIKNELESLSDLSLISKAKGSKHLKSVAKFLEVTDNIHNWFRTSVTTIFPQFHTRNALSNVILSMNGIHTDAFNPKLWTNALKVSMGSGDNIGIRSANGILYSGDEILNTAKRYGVLTDIRKMTDVAGAKNLAEDMTRGLNNFNPLSWAAKAGRKVGTEVENVGRVATYMGLLKQGHLPKDAARLTRKFMIDYGNLGWAEREVVSRLIPFYTFFRYNLPLQFEMYFKEPFKLGVRSRALSSALQKEDPYWIYKQEERPPMYSMEGEGNETTFFTSMGDPVEDVDRLRQLVTYPQAISNLYPLWKAAIEIPTGIDLRTGREFTEYAPKSLEPILKSLPKKLQQKLSFRMVKTAGGKTKAKMDPEILYSIRNGFFSRIFSSLDKVMSEDSIKSILTPYSSKKYNVEEEERKYRMSQYFTRKNAKSEIKREMKRVKR